MKYLCRLCVLAVLCGGWMVIVWPRVTGPDRLGWDFAINFTAAHALINGQSLYDTRAAAELSLPLGPPFAPLTGALFGRYIGPPTTALLYLPFTLARFPAALHAYRVVASIAYVLSIVIAGLALPPTMRFRAWALGGLALVLWHCVLASLVLGQVDAWIALVLAGGMLAARYGRWTIASAAITVAAFLKISPVILLVLVWARAGLSAMRGAVLTAVLLMAASLTFGRPSDWPRFTSEIAPHLSRASLDVVNQSLPGVIQRALWPGPNLPDLGNRGVATGIAMITALSGLWLLSWASSHGAYQHLALSLLIPVALLAGPISWDHYESWEVVPFIACADCDLWKGLPSSRRRLLFAVAAFSFLLLTGQMSPRETFPGNILSRLGTVALMGQFSVGLFLLRSANERARAGQVAFAPV